MCLGRSRKDKVGDLWNKVQTYYSEFRPPTRLHALSVEMIKRDGKGPNLRAKDAETRHLVPFAMILAGELYKASPTPHYLTVLRVAASLLDMYMHCSCSPYDQEAVADHCRQLCLLYASLSEEAKTSGRCDLFWRIKPKFHTMVELLE